MGFTGYGYLPPRKAYFYSDFQDRLARWINAPTTGLELIVENIVRNYHVRSQPLRLHLFRTSHPTYANRILTIE